MATLYVVATPIGNLEDITFRAVRVLREVSLIAAEDTRRTAKLLRHYGIATPTSSFHEHNERRKIPLLLGRLAAGEDIAVVSDAGTPGISDPGAQLVRDALEAGISVRPIPGPSALITALMVSGLPTDRVLFVGFPPSRAKERLNWLTSLADRTETLVIFEAPHRLTSTLDAMASVLGDRPIFVAREATKRHENYVKGPISSISTRLTSLKGEFTLIVTGRRTTMDVERVPPLDAEVALYFDGLASRGLGSRRASVRQTAVHFGISPKEAYQAIENIKYRAHDK